MHLIPNVNTKNCFKYPVCVEVKFAQKKLFKLVTTGKIEFLKLVQILRTQWVRAIKKEKKKRYIIFVDDCSRYIKVYLLKSKDEANEMLLKYKAEVENKLDRK